MLYQLKEWQDGSDKWHCEHTDSFPKGVQKWVIPARLLGISADEYVKILIEQFSPNTIKFNGETLIFSWDKQSDMRKYKNWINGISRKANFQI